MAETPSYARDCDELTATVKLLAEVVEESCEQIKLLKVERNGATGEVKDAYTLVITNKIWLLQTAIGKFWRETINLSLDNHDERAETKLAEAEEARSNASDSRNIGE
jgi:hypothetical protein